MIVVDTNIISYLYLNSDYSFNAVQMFEKDPIGSVPLLWRSEFRNVLSLTEALDIFEKAEELLINNEYEINSM